MPKQKQTRNREVKRVRLEGGSVVVTLGQLLPQSWELVRLVPVKQVDGESVTIRFEKVA